MQKQLDQTIGLQIKLRRKELKISQQKLGELVGVTFQQIQKYEKGSNRVSASRLFMIAKVLEVPFSYFFTHETEHLLNAA